MPTSRFALALLSVVASAVIPAHGQTPEQEMRVTFQVRYVTADAVYIDGGHSSGLAEGMALVIKAPSQAAPSSTPLTAPPASDDGTEAGIVARLKVVSVAETSAVCEVVSATRPLAPGDIAALPDIEVQALVARHALSSTRAYPAVVSFSEGDPLDEEVRDAVPHPPLPEVNMARGRFGFDYSSLHGAGGVSASTLGLVIRADITRINGTYWNLRGYWRGRLDSRSSSAQPTLQDLIDRTYHLSLTYDNPGSRWVMGFGRMYLPWASSLDTIDGGYFGRRLSSTATAGVFAGTTPDPTSWNYSVDRRIAGSFISFTGGDYDRVHYTSTFGGGISTLKWTIDRPFVFGENDLAYHHRVELFHSFQVDQPRVAPGTPAIGAGLARSFFTVRVQANPHVSFDLNHTYFRDVPTFDPQLIGTGLLDKTLFQGFSVGARTEWAHHISVYSEVGRSTATGDTRGSLNTMFGVSKGQIWKTGLRADFHFSRFNNSFAQGSYRSFSLSRAFGESLTGEVQFGTQSFISPFSKDNGGRFVNAHADVNLGARYFLEGGLTLSRGAQPYTQWYTMLGYRFDNRRSRLKQEATDAPKP